jgi:SAM-dependent methyltransferase
MQQRDIDCADRLSPVEAVQEYFGKLKRVKIGDLRKSWDVLKTVQFLEKEVTGDGAILDIGAFGSEILPILYRLNYRNLSGVDLNPKIDQMPHSDQIRYIKSDFMHTPFEDASFKAITSISVIEHGFNSQALVAETARLLAPGGYFIASFDFWPEKIDTSEVSAFDLDWRIFSKDEVCQFIKEAEEFGLRPIGKLNFEVAKPSVRWKRRNYTFAWLVLQKSA